MPGPIPSPIPWLVDSDLVLSMRREHAEAALQAGDFDKALSESEELLVDWPHDARALWISARASLSLGNACTAEAALFQMLALPETTRPVPPDALHTEMSFARFLQADFEAARREARFALELNPTRATAWVFLGIAEERLGCADAAAAAFQHAEQLQPGTAPVRPPMLPIEVWSRLLGAAKQELDPDEAAVLDSLTVEWQSVPEPDLLRSVEPPISPFVDLLISGDDAADDAADESVLAQLDAALKQAVPSPTMLTLYCHNLLRGGPDEGELIERMSVALRLELAAWLGISPGELSEDPP